MIGYNKGAPKKRSMKDLSKILPSKVHSNCKEVLVKGAVTGDSTVGLVYCEIPGKDNLDAYLQPARVAITSDMGSNLLRDAGFFYVANRCVHSNTDTQLMTDRGYAKAALMFSSNIDLTQRDFKPLQDACNVFKDVSKNT